MKYKWGLTLVPVVVVGLWLPLIKVVQPVFPAPADKTGSYQKERRFFERYLTKRRIPFVLPDIYRIDVVKLKYNRDWETYYRGQQPQSHPKFLCGHSFNTQNDPKLLLMLRQSNNFHTEHLQYNIKSDIVIYCWAAHDLDAAPYTYVYIPESGKLGRDRDWCQMSTNFQRAILYKRLN